MKSNVVLITSNKNSRVVLEHYEEIKKGVGHFADVVLLFHNDGTNVPEWIEQVKYYIYDDTILTKSGFKPIAKSLVPGSNHFPAMVFYQNSPNYRHYWVIEDDVRFSGDWALFFGYFEGDATDFLSSHIRLKKEDEKWPWWSVFHSEKSIDESQLVASFNPVYRLSMSAIRYLNTRMLLGDFGHHEVLIPTLLHERGYTLADLGGRGSFLSLTSFPKFYLYDGDDEQVLGGSMRWKPSFSSTGKLANRLYHPVKDFNRLFVIPTETVSQYSRDWWIEKLSEFTHPVLCKLSESKHEEQFTVECVDGFGNKKERKQYDCLEAFARTICGIAPWLGCTESGSQFENDLKVEYVDKFILAFSNIFDSDGYNKFITLGGERVLVEVAHTALAFIRAPRLWSLLSSESQHNFVKTMLLTRQILPPKTSAILFSGVIEVFLSKIGNKYDSMRIEYALNQFLDHWYIGDGMFSNGGVFSLGYYNSSIIHPFLISILTVINNRSEKYQAMKHRVERMAERYGVILEQSISADGSYPCYGKPSTYYPGAFHHLADLSWRNKLPAELSPGQVRCALGAVLNRIMGVSNSQKHQFKKPSMLESESVYSDSFIFLPLGLSPLSSFWSEPDNPWTSLKIWRQYDRS